MSFIQKEMDPRMWLQAVIVILLAYLVGSIPTAYILVKWRYHRDVTHEGSGNVGTLNVLRTTKSKLLSLFVFILDFLKGIVVALAAKFFFTDLPIIWGAMVIAVIVGHNYPIWLKFHGGRGLASGAGVLVVISPIVLGIWLAVWLLSYIVVRQFIFASVIATFGVLIFLWWPDEKFVDPEIILPVSIIGALVIIKHIPRVRQIWMSSYNNPAANE